MLRGESPVIQRRDRRSLRSEAEVGRLKAQWLSAMRPRDAAEAPEPLGSPDLPPVARPIPGASVVIGAPRYPAVGFSARARRPDQHLPSAFGRAWPPDSLFVTGRRGGVLAGSKPIGHPQGLSWLLAPSGHRERGRIGVPSGQASAFSRGIVASCRHRGISWYASPPSLWSPRSASPFVRASEQAVRVEAGGLAAQCPPPAAETVTVHLNRLLSGRGARWRRTRPGSASP